MFSIYYYKMRGTLKVEKFKESATTRSEAFARAQLLEGMGFRQIQVYEQRARKNKNQ